MESSAELKTWLITGCSTGIGRALAEEVLRRGHRAVVTARTVEQVADIVTDFPDTALALPLDVTNADQVKAALERTDAAFGGIDVLVNNAGYGYFSAVEEGEDDAVRAMFETNVFALFGLIQAVLPGMRARRSGHIVNVSSIGGVLGVPGLGYYNATKFAVEGLSEALAHETKPLGIRVTLIEPGPFRTDWAGRSGQHVGNKIADYADTAGARIAMATGNSGNQPGDPVRAAKAICDAVAMDQPPLHLVLGKIGLERVREKLKSFQSELDKWEGVTLATDFPEGEG